MCGQILPNLPWYYECYSLVQMSLKRFLNMYRWCRVNKHKGLAFVANDFLTSNSSTIRFVWLIDACLVSCFLQWSEVWSVHLCFHTPVCSLLKTPQCPRNSNCKYPPYLWISSSKRTPLALGIRKSHQWYNYGYFLESPNSLQKLPHMKEY